MLRFAAVVLALVALASVAHALGETPPVPTHWVTDGTGRLSPAVRDAAEARLGAYARSTGHQVIVWVGRSTGGDALEEWCARAFRAWRVGRQGVDDGVVLFLFTDDRRVRLEVGYGLEGPLPDAAASQVVRDVIAPRLRSGDVDGAVSLGVDRVLGLLHGENGPAAPVRAPRMPSLLQWILGGIAATLFAIFAIRHPALAFWLLASAAGRRGDRGGGGGGFSGGGGRSGGGGASG